VNSILKEIYDTHLVKDKNGKKYPLNSETSLEEGKYIHDIIVKINAKTTLETGMAFGISSLWICEALKKNEGRKHIAIDPAQLLIPPIDESAEYNPPDLGWRGIGVNNLERAGFSNFLELHQLSSHLALPKLEMNGTKIDFAFIDGMHTFDYTLIDFFYIDRLLKVGGVIVFDDLCIPAVNKVCRYALTNRAYSLYENQDLPRLSFNKKFILSMPFIGKKLKNSFKQEFLIPDYMLGISNKYYVAIKKERDDLITDGETEISRNWDHYVEF